MSIVRIPRRRPSAARAVFPKSVAARAPDKLVIGVSQMECSPALLAKFLEYRVQLTQIIDLD